MHNPIRFSLDGFTGTGTNLPTGAGFQDSVQQYHRKALALYKSQGFESKFKPQGSKPPMREADVLDGCRA